MNIILLISAIILSILVLVESGESLRNKVLKLQKELEITDGKLSSSSKRLKKQMKKEIRNNILPKVRKFVQDAVEKEVAERMIKKTRTMEESMVTLDNKLARVEERLKKLEDENVKLKTSTMKSQDQRVSKHRENNKYEFPESASDRSTRREMEFTERLISEVNDTYVPSDLNLTTPRTPLIPEDVTFNVSVDMPKAFDGVSLLVAADGVFTRILLDNPEIRGIIKTEKFVENIAYDHVSGTLFWSCNRPKRQKSKFVYSVGVDGSNLRLLLADRWVFSLAVDGAKQTVFMSDWTSSSITSVSTTGGDFKVIRDKFKTTIGQPKTIVVDGARIYVSFTSEILSMNYDGSDLYQLAKGSWMKPMALDNNLGILYFSDRKNLYGIDLQSKQKAIVNQLNNDINTMVFHDNVLYISYQKLNTSIDMLDLNANTVKAFTFVRGDWFRMCLIPTTGSQ